MRKDFLFKKEDGDYSVPLNGINSNDIVKVELVRSDDFFKSERQAGSYLIVYIDTDYYWN
jgi:hypothetical protein